MTANSPSTTEPGWLRIPAYNTKYQIGPTTSWKWRKEGLIETRQFGRIIYMRDTLPTTEQK